MQADDAPPPPPPDKKCMYYCRVLLGLLASCILLLGVSMQVRTALDFVVVWSAPARSRARHAGPACSCDDVVVL
jgi:hypothetical protein